MTKHLFTNIDWLGLTAELHTPMSSIDVDKDGTYVRVSPDQWVHIEFVDLFDRALDIGPLCLEELLEVRDVMMAREKAIISYESFMESLDEYEERYG